MNVRSWIHLDNQEPEPFFLSAWHRARALEVFEDSKAVATNFIRRQRYRGGATNEHELDRTTKEYYDNMIASDYIVCMRGGGNFSLRLYETLMMGRIPVFINTDCILPFEDLIDWKQHVVWIEYEELGRAPEIVRGFHDRLDSAQFLELQMSNRRLWEEYMNVERYLQYISGW
jgi:hypothetical protein